MMRRAIRTASKMSCADDQERLWSARASRPTRAGPLRVTRSSARTVRRAAPRRIGGERTGEADAWRCPPERWCGSDSQSDAGRPRARAARARAARIRSRLQPSRAGTTPTFFSTCSEGKRHDLWNDVADAAPQLGGIALTDVATEHVDAALSALEQTVDQPQHGVLPNRSVRSARRLPGRYFQRKSRKIQREPRLTTQARMRTAGSDGSSAAT